MKSESVGKHIIFAFLIALALYVVSFRFIEQRRQAKGPWEVKFESDNRGRPQVSAFQSALSISNVSFAFPDAKIDQTNLSKTVVFDHPTTNIPFGRVIYLDTTFLPGAITMEFFGHEIELLPRVLVIDRKEVPWQSDSRFELPQKHPAPAPGKAAPKK